MKKKEKTVQPCADCYVCGRGGTQMRYLGNETYRHDDCEPGSRNWCEWYDQHPEAHTSQGDILRKSRK